MEQLADKLRLEFRNEQGICWLAKAMDSTKLKDEKVKDEQKSLKNSSLALLGDSLLDLFVIDKLYRGDLTTIQIDS